MTRILNLIRHPWGWTSLPPLVCAVHCAVTPLVILLMPTLSGWKSLEWPLFFGSAIVGVVAVLFGGVRRGRWQPGVLVGGGFLVWGLSLAHALRPIPEDMTTVVAAMIVAAGLLWNSRGLCREAGRTCGECEGEGADLVGTGRSPVFP